MNRKKALLLKALIFCSVVSISGLYMSSRMAKKLTQPAQRTIGHPPADLNAHPVIIKERVHGWYVSTESPGELCCSVTEFAHHGWQWWTAPEC